MKDSPVCCLGGKWNWESDFSYNPSIGLDPPCPSIIHDPGSPHQNSANWLIKKCKVQKEPGLGSPETLQQHQGWDNVMGKAELGLSTALGGLGSREGIS